MFPDLIVNPCRSTIVSLHLNSLIVTFFTQTRYGLLCPKKAQLSAPKAINVFGDDEDSDMEDGADNMKKALLGEGSKHRVKKQTKLDMQRALDEDPTIYQYDEVFDDIKRVEEESKAITKKNKTSKYIANLLKTADRRKREQEHRIERMVQKEREAEGEMFADKESFVTSAYRAKLEEFAKMEEDEKNMERLEAIGDVTKQQDMSGFYRHLYHQTVDPAKITEPKATDKESKSTKDTQNIVIDANVDHDDIQPSSTDSDTGDDSRSKKPKESMKDIAKNKKTRQYRQRKVEASESESEAEETKDEVVQESKRESPVTEKRANEEDSEQPHKKIKTADKESQEDQQSSKDDVATIKQVTDVSKPDENNSISTKKKDEEDKNENTKIEQVEEENKPKVNIYEKRTVGEVYEAAMQRFYTRKAARSSGY